MCAKLQITEHTDVGPDTAWNNFSTSLPGAGKEIIVFKTRSHVDCFNDNSKIIHLLLDQKRKAHNVYFANPYSPALAERWKTLRGEVQRQTLVIENSWWITKAKEIQTFACKDDVQGFCNTLKAIS